ncbi:two-component regulator propeller domain-containing protein [Pedobacter heparinus]|uniref:ligand-binding sensor domain-containing protein n=1 Tax=Pedobacter heparinus TaxID=984 RepID=UPI0029309886|nr:two-component regulator propeller domain-containing protein [Pedobacter heparinus]
MKLKACLFLVVFFLVTNTLRSQSYYFRHYQVENGLSNNTIGCSLQDQQGFLWFGTKDGLNRFNGYTFKTFQNDRDDPTSIGSNFIISLYEDKYGVLWVGTDRGLFKYNTATESFSPVNAAPANEIRGIQMDNNDCLWFIVKNQLYKHDPKKGDSKHYEKLSSYGITSICMASDGNLWLSTYSGLVIKLNTVSNTTAVCDVFPKSEPMESRWIQKLYDTGKGTLLIGTASHGMKIFDIQTLAYRDIPLYSSDNTGVFVRDFVQHAANEYWIGTESGIFIYNIKNNKLVNLKKDYNNPYSISDNAIYTFCRDKEGGIWTGTYFGGINYYPKQNTNFKKYFPKYGSNSISGNAIREICGDANGNLWIGTEDAGLNKLNPATGIFTHFNYGSTKNKISHTNIHGLLINGNELWVGTFHKGLDVLNINTGKVTAHYTAAKHFLSSDFVCDILKTQSGKIIIATDRGLCYFNAQKNNFEAIAAVPHNFYTRIYEDKEGTIWAGTYSEGLYYFNPRTKSKGSFKYNPADKSSLGGNRINWIFEDSNNALWITTEGGLCRLDKQKGKFTNYTTKDGLPSNIIYTALEDATNNFWISTSKGLACFSPVSKKIITYTKINGLLNDQFNYDSAYKDATGRLYFGSVKGMISFHPAEFIKNTFLPPVYITSFQVYNKELEINKKGSPLKKSITNTDTITLKYDQSSFSIDFAALSYTAPEMTEYAYKLEGLDKDWTFLKTNRKVFFTELAAGTYVFKVKGSVGGDMWNGKPATLTIKILPPFWKSNWAYAGYLILIVAGIYFTLRSYHLRNEEKNRRKLKALEFEKEKEIYQAKIDFFTNVAHEIRTPLTLIKGPMEKALKSAEEIPAIKNNLVIMERNTDRLIDLTNQLLDFRKTEVNGFSFNLVKTDISEILKDNYARFKPTADQRKLQFELPDFSPFFAYVDQETFNKILSNVLNNAIKYAKTKVFIDLLLDKEGKSFTIKVKNDGYLIPDEMKERIFETFFRLKETEKQIGTGIGLAIARSLAELHKGTLELEKPAHELNVFVLKLPVNPKKGS